MLPNCPSTSFGNTCENSKTPNPNSNSRGGQSAESNGRVAGRIAAFNRFDTNSDGTVFLDEVPRQARRTVEIWLEQAGKSSDEG